MSIRVRRIIIYTVQGRSHEFAMGDKRGGLGNVSLPAGSRGRAQKPDTNANFQLRRGGTCSHVPPLATPLILCSVHLAL